VDCEARFGKGSPAVADMTEFGAVAYPRMETFHGTNCSIETFEAFKLWLKQVAPDGPIFISDNPAYDWQWINYYFWKYLGANPFGHSARRIGDFYAGLVGDFHAISRWKKLRVTKHDHNPVHDALGNAEAFRRIMNGERR
jgi:hypothetical protein